MPIQDQYHDENIASVCKANNETVGTLKLTLSTTVNDENILSISHHAI